MQVTEMSLNPCQNTAPQWLCSARAARPAGGQSFQNRPVGISHRPYHCCQMKKMISPLQNKSEGHFCCTEKLITRTVRQTHSSTSPAEELRHLLWRSHEGRPLMSTSNTAIFLCSKGSQYFYFWSWKEPRRAEMEKATLGKLSSIQWDALLSPGRPTTAAMAIPQHQTTNLQPFIEP